MSESHISSLYARVLQDASKAYNMPTMDDETQAIINSCIDTLRALHAQIIELSLFSPNDLLDDISTRDLIYLSVPFVFSEVLSRLMRIEPSERLPVVLDRQRYLQSFVDILENYNIVPKEERDLFDAKSVNALNPGSRRQAKVNQMKKEREIRGGIEKLSNRLRTPFKDESNELDLIHSVLLASSPTSTSTTSKRAEDQDLDSELEDVLRQTTLLLLRLLFTTATKNLESVIQEAEMLKAAPPRPQGSNGAPADQRANNKKEQEDMWRLDKPVGGTGPLLDEDGRPLRAFSILPAGTQNRQEYAARVFGPSHRLPTMTVDEYLEIERQRGNILEGGGPASEQEPTSKEKLALEAEMDGTVEGEEKAEEKRQQDEKWARYTDVNPKGAGNTMNRG